MADSRDGDSTGPRRGKRRPPPGVGVYPAGSPSPSPFDGLTTAEQWACRIAVLGKSVRRHWSEIITMNEEVRKAPKEFVRAEELARRLSISVRQVFRFVAKVGLASYPIGGKAVLYKWSEVEAAIEKLRRCRDRDTGTSA